MRLGLDGAADCTAGCTGNEDQNGRLPGGVPLGARREAFGCGENGCGRSSTSSSSNSRCTPQFSARGQPRGTSSAGQSVPKGFARRDVSARQFWRRFAATLPPSCTCSGDRSGRRPGCSAGLRTTSHHTRGTFAQTLASSRPLLAPREARALGPQPRDAWRTRRRRSRWTRGRGSRPFAPASRVDNLDPTPRVLLESSHREPRIRVVSLPITPPPRLALRALPIGES